MQPHSVVRRLETAVRVIKGLYVYPGTIVVEKWKYNPRGITIESYYLEGSFTFQTKNDKS